MKSMLGGLVVTLITLAVLPASGYAVETLVFPETVAGASAPHFLSGDTANASARPIDWVQVGATENRDNGRYVQKDYVRRGESAARWSELFTYMNTPKPDESPEAFMERQQAAVLKKCPGAIFTVLNQSDTEILYESTITRCSELGDQHELVRVIYGSANMFRLSYTVKDATIPTPRRDAALKLLSEFQLRPNS
jgi:hypothetical protein